MDGLAFMGILALIVGVIGFVVLYAGRRAKHKEDSVEPPGHK